MSGGQSGDLEKEKKGDGPDNATKLRLLAIETFHSLHEGEEQLIQAAAEGKIADYRVIKIKPDKPEDPSDGHKWKPDRTIRAELIKWLCTEPVAGTLITNNGIRINGAKMEDELNLDYMIVNMPILLHGCYVIGGISLRYAKVRTLEFTGTRVASINAEGANIDGRLCLDKNLSSYAGASKDINASACLSDAKISGSLICDHSHFRKSDGPALLAIALDVKGGVTFDSAVVKGTVDLSGATIGGDLTCTGTQFLDPNAPEDPSTKAPAVSSTPEPSKNDPDYYDSVTTKTVFTKASTKTARSPKTLRHERGLVLNGAEIGGNLDCSECVFGKGKQDALQATEAVVARHVLLEKVKAKGKVHIDGATIGGNLDCDGGEFLNKEKEDSPEAALPEALSAQRVQVKASIRLRDCTAEGTVNLYGAAVGGNVHCTKSKFTGPQDVKNKRCGTAFTALAAKVTGDLNLDASFVAKGKVILDGATIGGNLYCDGAEFNCDGAESSNEDKEALSVRRVEVKSHVGLIGSKAKGRIDFSGATVGGNLECSGGKFDNPGNAGAFMAVGAQVTGDLLLNDKLNDNKKVINSEVKGTVVLHGATVGGNLKLDGSRLENHDQEVLDCERADVKGSISFDGCKADGKLNFSHVRVGGTLKICEMAEATLTSFDLRFAVATTLDHAEGSWPKADGLLLNGLTYNAVGESFPSDGKKCVEWLQRQPKEEFSLQPYEQLAKVLKASGYKSEATNVLIVEKDDLRKYGDLGWLNKLWNWILGITIGHGYRSHRALVGMLLLVLLGAGIFGWSSEHKLMTRIDSKVAQAHYPKFNKFIYSLDTLLPIIDLKQKSYWLPDYNAKIPPDKFPWGNVVFYYLWLHMSIGWLLTTLWVAGFSGLVRKLSD